MTLFDTVSPSLTVDCPHCGTEHPATAFGKGFECEGCDFSLLECPGCGSMMIVLPVGESTVWECPQCETGAAWTNELTDDPLEDDALSCDNCDWTGSGHDAGREMAQCPGCSEYYPLERDIEIGDGEHVE